MIRREVREDRASLFECTGYEKLCVCKIYFDMAVKKR